MLTFGIIMCMSLVLLIGGYITMMASFIAIWSGEWPVYVATFTAAIATIFIEWYIFTSFFTLTITGA